MLPPRPPLPHTALLSMPVWTAVPRRAGILPGFPMPEMTCTIGELDIAYETFGEPSDPALLLVMGLGTQMLGWHEELCAEIAARGFFVIRFDNRGTGESSPVRARLTMRGLADDVADVLDAAGVESAHIIGASMGGMIAQHVALDHRERVRSLILACTTPGGPAGVPPWRLLATAALRPLLGARRTFPLVAPALYSRATLTNNGERMKEDLKRRMEDSTSAITVYAQLGAVALHDTRSRLGELAGLETLVIHGLEDGLVPPARGRDLAERIPGAKLELIPACGHLLTTDAEEQTATAILDHLARAAERTTEPVQ